MKIIPAIDLMQGSVVRLFKGKAELKTVYSDNPVEIAKKWESEGADMLHIVDLDAAFGIGSNFSIMNKISDSVKIPVEVAGGLRNEKLIDDALSFADRVVIGTMAFQKKVLIQDIIKKYSSQRIVISVDHVDGMITTHGWQTTTDIQLIDAIKEFTIMGATEFLSTNVSLDGTMMGPDLKNLHELCQLENINIIASGGISKLDDILQVKKENPFGIILGKAMYEKKISIRDSKKLT